jgi:hypothetical protein
MLDRLAQAEAMGPDDIAPILPSGHAFAVSGSLVTQGDACVTWRPYRRAGRPADWRSRVCCAVLVARGAGDFATIGCMSKGYRSISGDGVRR